MSQIFSQKKDQFKTPKAFESIGEDIYSWAEDLFPICRSISGEGVRETLRYFQRIVPDLKIEETKSGTQVFDWTVPTSGTFTMHGLRTAKAKKLSILNILICMLSAIVNRFTKR